MNSELTNLLPFMRRTLLYRRYRVRRVVTVMISAAVLLVAFVLLLYPSHVRVAQGIETARAELAHAEEVLSSTEDQALPARLENLGENVAALISHDKDFASTEFMREVLALSREGVALMAFEYAAYTNSLVLKGTARSRDALRAYQKTLQEVPLVVQADLPVSAYAQESNISFAITLILAP